MAARMDLAKLKMLLGKHFKEAREAEKISQTKLAIEIEVHWTSVVRAEQGNFGFDVFFKLAIRYGIPDLKQLVESLGV